MSTTNQSSALHTRAANDHEAAAKLHHSAASHHDHNKLADAKASSKSAMDCSTNAHKLTTNACISSDK